MKLTLCPFCGNKDVTMMKRNGKDGFRDRFYVLCDYNDGGCGASGGWYHSESEAAEMWNKRACIERIDKERMKCGGKWHADRYWLGFTDAMRKAKRIADGTIDDEPTYSASVESAIALDDLIPDEPVPDSAWTDKIPDDTVHVSTKFSK